VDDITGRMVHAACEQGDPLAARLVDATAEYLGLGLAGVANAFNPRRVVLGRGVIEGHPPYMERARDIVRQRALRAAVSDLTIVESDLNGQAGVIGAATMARTAHRANASQSAPTPAR